VALIVIAAVLPKTSVNTRPIIDYAGIALLAGAATCVVLISSFAGSVGRGIRQRSSPRSSAS
jgi:hypothetical protein